MTNPISNILKITHPIIQGGMGNISNAILASAVSEAGGLGTIGCGTMTPTEVKSIITETKKLTNKPFAINIPISVNPYTEDLVQLVINEKVPVVSLSAGNPSPYIPLLQKNDIKVIAIIAAVKHAEKAEKAGADILVAEGFEAAGINSSLELTTFTLIPQIVDRVNIPIVAAGGIGDGRGLAAAYILGANGVQMGTRFIATKEAPFHENYKQSILQATDLTARIIGRSVGRTRRVLQNEYATILEKKEKEGISLEKFNEMTTEKQHIKGAIEGDFTSGFINGGQISGLVTTIPSVKELIEQMTKEASEQINRINKQLQTE